MLPSNKALDPTTPSDTHTPQYCHLPGPWSQILDTFCPERKVALRSTLRNLRCSKISIGRLSAEEPGVLSKPGGYHVPIRKGFGTQGSAESSSTSIGPYKSSESTILRCS